MTAMQVIYTGPEHRLQVVPVFEESGVVVVTIREGGTAEAAGPGSSATNSAQPSDV
jgi:hypothetical protein